MNAQDEQNVINQAIEILEARLQKPEQALCSPQDTFNYLKLKLSELEHEVFSILFLDNQNRLLKSKELFRGTIDGAAVYPREVVKAALAFNAAAVIFAHNHPSGVSEPSTADRHITERLKSALELVDIRTLDHVIVGQGAPYSFAERGLL
ncbi:RadC family protein [Oceanobacter antarcticus]|uniref:DNA repair protein RadC n=1 Tax=Oceanobacter antarcticus TaxID=3133425 RepID=A0ABW8NDT6_9GAMM